VIALVVLTRRAPRIVRTLGLGRVGATVVGGLVFGLVETLGQTMVPGLGAGWANAIAFAILVLVLIVRPQGLMGRIA